MSRKEIYSKKKVYRLVMFLSRKGGLYKQDFLSYANKLYVNKQQASRVVRQLLDKGVIMMNEFVIKDKVIIKNKAKAGHAYYKGAKPVQVVTLTDHGINVVSEFYKEAGGSGNLQEQSELRKLRRPFEIKERTTNAQYKEMLSHLNANRIKVMFNLADIQTEPVFKPSLEQIHAHRNGLPYTPSESSPYRYYPEQDELESALDKGFYYSIAEYREFFDTKGDGKERLFTIARGLFIANDITLVIYSNGFKNNSMIFCPNYSSETTLINALKTRNLSFNTVDGNIDRKQLSNMLFVDYKSKTVDALTLSDTESFIYSTAAGKRYGKTTKRHKSNAYENKLLTPRSPIFDKVEDGYRDLRDTYENFYCIVHNKDGVEMLKRLLNHNQRASYETCKNLSKEYPDKFMFDKADKRQPLKFKEDSSYDKVIYLPVYELLTLLDVKERADSPLIICDKSMRNTVQHITHKEHVFLDIDDIEILDADTTPIYDKQGYIAGKKMIDDELKQNNLRVNQSEYYKAAARYDIDITEFYNAIANEEIDLDEVIEDMETYLYDPDTTRAVKKSVLVPEDIWQQIKDISNAKHVTIYHTTCKLLKQALNQNQNK